MSFESVGVKRRKFDLQAQTCRIIVLSDSPSDSDASSVVEVVSAKWTRKSNPLSHFKPADSTNNTQKQYINSAIGYADNQNHAKKHPPQKLTNIAELDNPENSPINSIAVAMNPTDTFFICCHSSTDDCTCPMQNCSPL
jgi:hypothetical protein